MTDTMIKNPVVTNLTPAELKAGSERYRVFDVRPAADFARKHIAIAVSMPLEEIGARLNALPKDKRIAFYSENASCARAQKAVEEAVKLGHDARLLTGGLEAWMKQGFEVEPKA